MERKTNQKTKGRKVRIRCNFLKSQNIFRATHKIMQNEVCLDSLHCTAERLLDETRNILLTHSIFITVK